jgi:hypothetical protein
MPPQDMQVSPSHKENFEEEEDKYLQLGHHAGALTDLVILKYAGYSGYAIWRKPRPSTLRCYGKRAQIWQ